MNPNPDCLAVSQRCKSRGSESCVVSLSLQGDLGAVERLLLAGELGEEELTEGEQGASGGSRSAQAQAMLEKSERLMAYSEDESTAAEAALARGNLQEAQEAMERSHSLSEEAIELSRR